MAGYGNAAGSAGGLGGAGGISESLGSFQPGGAGLGSMYGMAGLNNMGSMPGIGNMGAMDGSGLAGLGSDNTLGSMSGMGSVGSMGDSMASMSGNGQTNSWQTGSTSGEGGSMGGTIGVNGMGSMGSFGWMSGMSGMGSSNSNNASAGGRSYKDAPPSPAPPANLAPADTTQTSKWKSVRMCQFFLAGGCKNGTECTFAHSEDELIKGTSLYVSNLPMSVTEEQVNGIFAPYGALASVKVLPNKMQRPNRSALVRFVNESEAQWVVDNVHNTIPPGLSQPVLIKPPKDDAPAAGSAYGKASWKGSGSDWSSPYGSTGKGGGTDGKSVQEILSTAGGGKQDMASMMAMMNAMMKGAANNAAGGTNTWDNTTW
eukprot:gnl/TRDRNA2_/TRDRNA2_163256_c2_seq2.p1 gnl/TRDRNA2_/TRDRNA2_163256_c2~~gnl/TRDRNA2_/TRDRNA2_163256_c2_seq2.p1  ORF type:complete len:426 (+),score=64.18 gnl/TRDRNA2_/TRDRNA2_163256_c2_seq2:167-1279(+)